MIDGDGRAVARNDTTALQVRNEVNVTFVVGQHGPCGFCVGIELGTALDLNCVGAAYDADGDRCRSGALRQQRLRSSSVVGRHPKRRQVAATEVANDGT